MEGNQEMAKLSNKENIDDKISSEAIRPLRVGAASGITQMKRRSSFTEQRVLRGSAVPRYTGKPI